MNGAGLIHREMEVEGAPLARPRPVEPVFFVTMALVAGAVAGFITIRIHPLAMFVLFGAVGVLLIQFRWPWSGVPILVGMTCFVPFHSSLPFTDVGSIHLPDLWLGGLVAWILIQHLRGKQPLYLSSLSWAVFVFCLAGLGVMVLGCLRFGTNLFDAVLEYKVVLYYLLAWIIPSLIRDFVTFKRCVMACLILAGMVSILLVTRAVLNPITESMSSGQAFYAMQDRAGGSGTILVFWGFCTTLGLMLFDRFRWGLLVVCISCLLFFGLMFQRHMYIAIGLCCGLYMCFTLRTRFVRLLQLLMTVILGVILLAALAFWGPESLARYPRLTVQRLVSIGEDDAAESLSYRHLENSYAVKVIKTEPATGIGFARSYRPALYEHEKYGGATLDRFLHHSYLWILLKMGALGLFTFLAMLFLFFRSSIRILRRHQAPFVRAVVLGGICGFVGLLMVNFVAPYFMQDWGTAAVGAVLGFSEAARRIGLREPSPEHASGLPAQTPHSAGAV